ncbi:M23 family metallopeptidase [Sediminibacillus halophilus]|uniref:Murein DD-endopeptidase MepM and murein hydrolase activator NlpD, contain LysM domain n=1 Tax=Sediminibacillus halophilus TaxID=482461 RepID=A0A1G9T1T9_9BACI|nr:M23 family metallopeptidase [Sediminibacillus halophilus]SDM41651.1 Murein DD-endopeptidase MepM and murein hydrolase activator NlpD, contain LysM domain [Sediminibacillus halophilus]
MKIQALHKETKRRRNKWFTTAAAALAGFALSFQVVQAAEDDLDTVYHVYMDGESVGTVADKQTVDETVDKVLAEHADDYKGYSLTTGEEISFVPEKVFEPVTEEKQVVKTLEDELTVNIDAFQLVIGDEKLGFFKSEQAAKQVLTSYKERFVDAEVLKKLADGESEVPTNDGKTLVTGVELSEDVKVSEAKADPDDMLSEKQGLKQLEKGTLKDTVHSVNEGEVLGEIAGKYDMDIDDLLELNPELTEESVLQIDQDIHVAKREPYLQVIVSEETEKEEAIPYEKEVKESDSLYKGESEVKQEGEEGSKQVRYAVKKVNGQVSEQKMLEETTTKEPTDEIVVKGTKVETSHGSGSLQWPAVGGTITSQMGHRWGKQHKGIDIAGVSNRSILAADNGVVVSAGFNSGGYGNKVVIDHQNGYRTVYAHLASIRVKTGQTVAKGSKIGVMGSTGDSTGVHLHFEVYKNGALQNPANLF